MPGSSDKGKTTIKKWFKNISSKRLILDIGPGWGTYSKLLREPRQIWHAVEIHKPYIKKFELEKHYEKIFNKDIRNFEPNQRYDVVICGDVLEHIENNEAKRVLKVLLEKSDNIIISLPLDAETNPLPGTGDVDWGNPYEIHLGKWSHQLFIKTIRELDGKIIAFKKFTEIAIYLISPSKPKKYKIIGICQVYNELEKGNLKRFLKYTLPLVDGLVVYDDGSTDGSFEYLQNYPSDIIHILRNPKNDFADEINHRKLLLKKALELKTDFILWLDADEILTVNAKEKLQEICRDCEKKDIDAVDFHELNIWRSATWRRIDSLYEDGWFPRIWRVTSNLGFNEIKRGLHQPSFVPTSIKKRGRTKKIAVLHYGFSNKLNLAYKYLVYRAHGQRGYDNLDRLIDENKLKLEKIPEKLFPKELWKKDDEKPNPVSFIEALSYVEKYKDQVFRPKYSIACLIYKSVDWLKFVYEQVLRYTDLTDKEFYFVANDATPEVLKYLKDNYIPHYIFNNTENQKKQWYINNVYRAWNFAAQKAKGDFIVFINSDMAFTARWFENIIKLYNGKNCLVSRLVESGKLKSGTYGIEKNFGKNYKVFQERAFQRFAASISINSVKDKGLYMPLLVRKDHFLKIGGYPEGNVKLRSNIFHPKIARQGEEVIPGDVVLMEKLKTIGITHQTVFNSIVYHFQCGEMDAIVNQKNLKKQPCDKVEIAICNDLVTGVMGEKVLWDHLIENLPGAYGVDERKVGKGDGFEKRASYYINQNHPQTKIIIQNATFISGIDSKYYTIAFLQDDLRSMQQDTTQQEANLVSDSKIVANSLQTAVSYADYDCEVVPIGVDNNLFKPMNKKIMRQKHGFGSGKIGIFVGNFSEVKGWSKVEKCIRKYPEITWILVSKYEESYQAKNVKVYNRISQKLLAELLNCADFFILGSPVETLCLAAIEACFCNIPVVMPQVGIFKNFSQEELTKIGVFGDDLEKSVKNIFKNKFQPRILVMKKQLDIESSVKKWQELIGNIMLEINIKENLIFNRKIHLFYREKIKKIIFGDEEFDLGYFLKTQPKKTVKAIKIFIIKTTYQALVKTGLLPIIKKILKYDKK